MSLPHSNIVPVNLLAACFNKTVATYKFYWLLAILESVEKGEQKIFKKDLFARMVSNAWYTVNYFHVSFGKQDRLQRAIRNLMEIENITIDEGREVIFHKLQSSKNLQTSIELMYFDNQVPHWFLSPWFPGSDKQTIYNESRTFSSECMYALYSDQIFINPEWRPYILENIKIIRNFCYWNLVLFLQKKNPNVPDIPNKVIKPAFRNSLTRQRNTFWNNVFREVGTVQCIYTEKPLTINDYAVEHFIPYSFVSHDLIWNLIPADPSFNSTKSNRLPRLEKYFIPFFEIQQKALEINNRINPNNVWFEDYLTIFPNLEMNNNFNTNFTADRFRETLQPLITIASNNGFEYMK